MIGKLLSSGVISDVPMQKAEKAQIVRCLTIFPYSSEGSWTIAVVKTVQKHVPFRIVERYSHSCLLLACADRCRSPLRHVQNA